MKSMVTIFSQVKEAFTCDISPSILKEVNSMSFENFLMQFYKITKEQYLELSEEEQDKIDAEYLVYMAG